MPRKRKVYIDFTKFDKSIRGMLTRVLKGKVKYEIDYFTLSKTIQLLQNCIDISEGYILKLLSELQGDIKDIGNIGEDTLEYFEKRIEELKRK